MPLQAGTALGHYTITAPLGAGGMGEVYRARDTKLDREVAIKVLPEGFAADRERVARFEREAKSLAALNHPNIATIHGFEQDADTHFLVMELVEGEDLAERLERGPVPVVEAIALFVQIAEGLEAAHEKGIIHRDLKPANLKVSANGRVKILDFGLATAMEPPAAVGGTDMSQSPTMTAAATMRGEIMGTAAYMSPEQARGEPVGKQTDIWAFGCVLGEVLAGRRIFEGEDTVSVLSSVLRQEIDFDDLASGIPYGVRRVVESCLQRSQHDRLRDAGDASLMLRSALERGADDPPVQTGKPSRVFLAGIAVAALVVGALGTLAVQRLQSRPESPQQVRILDIAPPEGDFAHHPAPAISPDGTRVAFWLPEGKDGSVLWLRDLETGAVRELSPTMTRLAGSGVFALPPFWSPDGEALGYFADSSLYRLDLDSETPIELAPTTNPRGGTWSRRDEILFVDNVQSSPKLVSALGGDIEEVVLERDSTLKTWPVFLPDDEHFLITAGGGEIGDEAWLANLEGQVVSVLDTIESRLDFANGYVFFVDRDTLFARRLDLAAAELSESRHRIVDGVGFSDGGGWARSFSVAASGELVFSGGTLVPTAQLTWIDRSGQVLGTLGEPGESNSFVMSPDERTVVVEQHRPRLTPHFHLWNLDVSSNTLSRLITAPDDGSDYWVDMEPVWSPDGRFLLFSTFPGISMLSMPGREVRQVSELGWATSVGPKGEVALLRTVGANDQLSIRVLSLADGAIEAWLDRNANDSEAMFSPDGRWVAFVSDASGSREVYVRPFRGPGREVQISFGGGSWPLWRGDGRELFYIRNDGMLMAVGVETDREGWGSELAQELFQAGIFSFDSMPQYWPSPDGKRFLVNRAVEGAVPRTLSVVLNWQELVQ